MAEFPALPLWTDAYLADTLDLSVEEHGVYLLLMIAAWRRPGCSLPDDDAWLCRLLHIHGNRWRPLRKSVLERFFVRNSAGDFEQKRLRKERDFCEKRRRIQRENIAKRWAKAKENKDIADTALVPHGITPTTHTHTYTDSKKAVATATAKESLSAIGTRLPDEWPLTPELMKFALNEGFSDEAAERMFANFCDYWRGKPGAEGRKRDWVATWRVWVRNQRDRAPRQNGNGTHPGSGVAGGYGAFGQDSRLAAVAGVVHARKNRAHRDK